MQQPTTPQKTSRRIKPIATLLVLAVLGASAALAQLPQTNPASVTWVRESSSAWSFSEQTNPAGVTVQLAAGADAAPEITNAAGVTAFIGLLDGEIRRNAAGVSWQMYDINEQP